MTLINLVPQPYINVAQYGLAATNTAAQNDTAIAEAIAAIPSGGGVLLFPSATYYITSSVIIDQDNVSLVGFGQRGGASTLYIDPSADPTWAVIFGNTKNVAGCLIANMNFVGRNNGTSTGGGILFRSTGSKISQCRISLFGGKGISLDIVSGSGFEVYLEDVNLNQNGMNTTTHDDNLVIGSSVGDCEYHRVISNGNAAKNTTRNGIQVNGGNHKFVDCHAYFCSNDGINNVGGSKLQIVGGEFETNGAYGIESSTAGVDISGANFYGNALRDISIYNVANIRGCQLSSAVAQNIYWNAPAGGSICDNIISGGTNAIQLDSASSGVNIHDNNLSSSSDCIITKSTNSTIHDNELTGGGITEQTGAQGNNIHDNFIPSGKTITRIGTTTKTRNNPGFNPVGQVTAPTFPATTVAATNTTGVDVTANIANGVGAITVIQIAGNSGTYVTTGMQIAASGWGSVRIPVGGGVKFTYASGVPSWTWFGD